MDSLGISEIFYGKFPQCRELGVGSAGRAPPWPVLGMFMERTEHDRNQSSATVLQTSGEVGASVQPRQELGPGGSAGGQYLLRDLV